MLAATWGVSGNSCRISDLFWMSSIDHSDGCWRTGRHLDERHFQPTNCRVHHNIIQQPTTTYDLTVSFRISIEMFWWPGVATSPKAGEMVWTGGWAFASIGSQKRLWHLSHLNLIIGFAPLACTRHVAQEFQGQTCFNKRKIQAFRNFLWCNMICEISTGSTGSYSSTGCWALSPFHKLGLILKRGSLMVIIVLSV